MTSLPTVSNRINALVSLQGAPDTTIQLTFLDMDIEIEDQCRYDYVEVRVDGGDEDGERFCGTNLPDVQTSTGNRMVVKFFSDFYLTSPGFRASYVIVEPPPPTLAPCDQTLTDIEGEITTPNYPGDYEIGRECIYTIQVGVVFFFFFHFRSMFRRL